jgi:hypothetical protein
MAVGPRAGSESLGFDQEPEVTETALNSVHSGR